MSVTSTVSRGGWEVDITALLADTGIDIGSGES